jgi:hypothetical protein
MLGWEIGIWATIVCMSEKDRANTSTMRSEGCMSEERDIDGQKKALVAMTSELNGNLERRRI